jgi:hypothetical protein
MLARSTHRSPRSIPDTEDWGSCGELHHVAYRVLTPNMCTAVVTYTKYTLDIGWLCAIGKRKEV